MAWKVGEAKAQFSLLVKRAQKSPQFVLLRDKPIAVVLSVQEYERLLKERAPAEGIGTKMVRLAARLRKQHGDDALDFELPPRKRLARGSPFED